MRWLLFLSRLAFICGIFFLLSFSLLIKKWTTDDSLISTIIVIGYFMGALIVPFTVISYLVVLVLRKKLTASVPSWLVFANILFLFVLLYYIFYLNDHPHY
jgi:hypothetical protein